MTARTVGVYDLPLFAAQRPGRCAALRALLADGEWHAADELRRLGGWRYGARLYELRRGLDGGPALDVLGRRRRQGQDEWWEYAAVQGGDL